ncbi:S-layer homology domain-containing protein [Sporosarcina sp. PTS2304]|uniref:S-layer homology domain-containing protein n=1 Tax=Sporosarcina sp. PTS2304 TaxID=2283194 RepID=UPI000E0CF2DC|nr:S-layer homology domain-containing protein [Sporosarcina sp. PTS2304]AXH99108.1 S-layer homology domain-containing protein [Sporosarcina sp. PTS2304]
MKEVVKVALWTLLLLGLSFVYMESGVVSAKEFKDVSTKHPNYKAIQEMQKAGFISGYPDGSFRPQEPVSRKHVAVLLDKALKFPQPTTQRAVFSDVPKSHAYYAPIMKLYDQGIVSGANGKFNPESSLTRIQMAKMLDLAFDFNMTEHAGFSDLLVTHWGYVHANALYANHVASGDRGQFKPNEKVTRAHYAEFLYRAMQANTAQPTGDALVKKEALDKLFRLTSLIERTFHLSEENHQTFNQVRSEFLHYATPRYVDEIIGGVYRGEFDYLPYVNDTLHTEVKLRLEYSKPDPDVLHVSTIQFRNLHDDKGGFVHAVFIKDAGQWKISSYDVEFPGTKNFQLTVDEAKFAIQDDYDRHGFQNVRITYVSKSQVTGEDYMTHEKYTFDKYKFMIDSHLGLHYVTINSDSGLIN